MGHCKIILIVVGDGELIGSESLTYQTRLFPGKEKILLIIE